MGLTSKCVIINMQSRDSQFFWNAILSSYTNIELYIKSNLFEICSLFVIRVISAVCNNKIELYKMSFLIHISKLQSRQLTFTTLSWFMYFRIRYLSDLSFVLNTTDSSSIIIHCIDINDRTCICMWQSTRTFNAYICQPPQSYITNIKKKINKQTKPHTHTT